MIEIVIQIILKDNEKMEKIALKVYSEPVSLQHLVQTSTQMLDSVGSSPLLKLVDGDPALVFLFAGREGGIPVDLYLQDDNFAPTPQSYLAPDFRDKENIVKLDVDAGDQAYDYFQNHIEEVMDAMGVGYINSTSEI